MLRETYFILTNSEYVWNDVFYHVLSCVSMWSYRVLILFCLQKAVSKGRNGRWVTALRGPKISISFRLKNSSTNRLEFEDPGPIRAKLHQITIYCTYFILVNIYYIYRVEAWGSPESNSSSLFSTLKNVIIHSVLQCFVFFHNLRTQGISSTCGQHIWDMLSDICMFLFCKFFHLCSFGRSHGNCVLFGISGFFWLI